jgi:dTDP-4-amino-4,6-dideoxygalactose transaminase
VITPSYSCFASAGAVARRGAKPVFVDIDADTFNIAPSKIEAKITAKTRAILPVHLYGRCADLDPILAVAAKRGIPVIEDAAQAIGAADAKGRQAGQAGVMGCFSFFPTKNLGAFGDGGMVTTNDAALAESLRMLRVHGMKPKYYHKVVGGNFRLDALQAAVLRVKLKHLPAWSEARRRNAGFYRRQFEQAGLSKAVLPNDVPGHIYNQFVIRVPRRDKLIAFLADKGVGTEIYYPLPLHLQECFASLGNNRGDMPVSEAVASDSLALPIYPELTEAQMVYVVDQIKAFGL